ncbi:MAG: ABC transporter substrate-binding protein [Acidimicrobiia bacterium]|nr:ABC transporter substrate-binding protein [Acidimicrobiia bacterium]
MRTTATHPPIRRLLAVLGALALLAGACGGSDDSDDASTPASDGDGTDAPSPVTGGEVVIGLDAESDGYNPATNRFAHAGHTVASAVYDPLAAYNDEGVAVPYLAESIEPNDSFDEWTITLPEGVEYHNGEPVTAEAVVEVLEAHQEGLVTSSTITDISGFEVVDPLTFRVTTARPWANFPSVLTTQVGYVMAPSMLTDPDSAANPVGTGPFRFESWEQGESWTGVRFDDYWQTDEEGNQLPYLEEIEFRFIPDPQARQQALENGDVDLIHTRNPNAILELRDSDFQMVEWDRGEEDLISLNTEQPPFDNEHARRALAHATDQEAFIRDVLDDVYVEANGPFALGQAGHLEDTGYPEYDPELAEEALAQYTAETGQDTLSFTYTGSDDVFNLESQRYLADMWAEVGIQAEVEAIPQSEVIFRAVTGQYEAIDWRNWGQPEPDADFPWWHSSSVRPPEEGISVNIARFADDEVDEALETARGTVNEEVADEAYQTVNSPLSARRSPTSGWAGSSGPSPPRPMCTAGRWPARTGRCRPSATSRSSPISGSADALRARR